MGEERIAATKTHNFGIDILRVWMCFEVILIHFGSIYIPEGTTMFRPSRVAYSLLCVAVPSFLFVSFLLCAPLLNNPSIGKRAILDRLRRISVPILFWGVVYFLVEDLSALAVGKPMPATFADLAFQLLTGHVYNVPMWYMNVLLALTLTVVMINKLVPRRGWVAANIVMTVGALAFCWSGLNYRCFDMLDFEFRYTMGRYFEMMPLAGAANLIYLSGAKVPEGERRIRSILILMLICFCAWLTSYTDIYAGFGYGSPYQFLFPIPFVLLMWILPLNGLDSLLRHTITPLARCTLGIYCLHFLIGDYVNALCRQVGWPENTSMGCVAIFAISYAICRLMTILPWRFVRKAVS